MNRVFLDILIVLVAAKIAAEGAERLSIPPVVGEIMAGILIGPSMLGLVHGSGHGDGSAPDVLRTLGEIGVILLLLEVGMHMDLRELKAVGRSAMTVAVIGVVLPFGTGFLIAEIFGLSVNQALFTSAALAATSVGITARVFGDLRALSTVEARTVLGAAVADDVIGLVILTIVVRVATGEGAVTFGTVAGVIALALAFLVVTTLVGTLGAPRLFAEIDRFSRSSGTLFALALAFTLGIAELASLAKLAPIVGAFVAGLSLGRSPVAQRIQRELTPVGHLFIPVFFLQIGIDTDVSQFVKPAVLGMAGALIAVAVLGKVAAGLGAGSAGGNRLLIGIGMIPRGEVGLIFAGVGLREGVLGENSYAAILLMVLVTTLITPPLLTAQLKRVQRSRLPLDEGGGVEPTQGWLQPPVKVGGSATRPTFGLTATPPRSSLLPVSLEAALLSEHADPDRELVDWIRESARVREDAGVVWDRTSTDRFLRLLEGATPRAWRLLDTTGVLEVALPELSEALSRRRLDLAVLDGAPMFAFELVDRVRRLRDGVGLDHPWDQVAAEEFRLLEHPQRLALAALLIESTRDLPSPVALAQPLLERLALDTEERTAIARLVNDQELLRGASLRADGLAEDAVLRVAAHLGDHEQARGQFILSVAMNDLETWEADLLIELHRLVSMSLDVPELTGAQAGSLLDRQRDQAFALVDHSHHRDRIAAAPLAYLLSEDPASIARHARLLHPMPMRGKFRVAVHPEGERLPSQTGSPEATGGRLGDVWRIEVVTMDRLGLLAVVTAVLDEAHLDVLDAVLATWGDGAALQAFRVRTDVVGLAPDAKSIEKALIDMLGKDLVMGPVPDAVISFDDVGSPWHTLAEVRATDRRGLLHALAVAFAAAGADVHAARVTTADSMAFDRFDLTDRDGHKLRDEAKAAIREALQNGVSARPLGRRLLARTGRIGAIRRPS